MVTHNHEDPYTKNVYGKTDRRVTGNRPITVGEAELTPLIHTRLFIINLSQYNIFGLWIPRTYTV